MRKTNRQEPVSVLDNVFSLVNCTHKWYEKINFHLLSCIKVHKH